jgi:hypothetical protein
MFFHVVVAWLLLAGLVLFAVFALTLGHYVLMCLGRRNRLRPDKRRRIPGFFVAAGLLFLQLMSELYSPGAAFVLREVRDEDADEDDQGDPESITKQLSRQLKRIRRGELVGDLVLRL